MQLERGLIVCSKAGRDCGSFMVVVDVKDGKVFVADGKERLIERPKQKNIKHISLTLTTVPEEQMLTNRSIRHALRDFQSLQCQGEI